MTKVTQEQLRELLDFSIEFMKKSMKDSGSVVPMVHAVKKNGEMVVVATPFTDERSKNAIMTMVKVSFLAWEVTHYVQFSEAWVRTFEPDELDDRREVRDYDDKREVLVSHAVSDDHVILYAGEIERDWTSGAYTGIKDERIDVIDKTQDEDAAQGRMLNLLPPPEVRLAFSILPEDRRKAFIDSISRKYNVSVIGEDT